MPFRLISTVIAVFLSLPALPALAAESDDVVFEGSGWGHGIGMSQYGAYGMALNSFDAASIISHYYQGTSVAPAGDTSVAGFLVTNSEPLWVGLMQNRAETTFTLEGGGGDLCQFGDGEGDCPKAVRPQAGETWKFYSNSEGRCVFERVSPASPLVQGTPGNCGASVTPDHGATITVVDEGYSYSSGVLRFRAVPSAPETFHVMLQVGVEPYLRGIAEMPSKWHIEALKAQAIAARSYLLSNATARGPQSGFSSDVREDCWCHLYDDARSQVFRGDIDFASPNWHEAIAQTAGQVVSYQGKIVNAFYSSSSGGQTENVEHVWVESPPAPWLVSVDDHWAYLPAVENPLSSWTSVKTRSDVAAAVELDVLHEIAVAHRSSGAASEVQLVGEAEGQAKTVSITGYALRRLLGLPSHYFSIQAASTLNPSAYTIPSGTETPIGWLEDVSFEADAVRVRGWMLDPDTPLPINGHVYVDGKFKAGFSADNPRGDVERAFHNGKYHGFNEILTLSPGSHEVCVNAINAPSKKGNPEIGCRLVTVPSDQPMPPPDDEPPPPSASGSHAPFGWLDRVEIVDDMLVLRGWAIDEDLPDQAVGIHVYVDGQFFVGGPANVTRLDVDRAIGLGAEHGFSFDKAIEDGSHRVCVHAINLPEKKNNTLLGCRTVG